MYNMRLHVPVLSFSEYLNITVLCIDIYLFFSIAKITIPTYSCKICHCDLTTCMHLNQCFTLNLINTLYAHNHDNRIDFHSPTFKVTSVYEHTHTCRGCTFLQRTHRVALFTSIYSFWLILFLNSFCLSLQLTK